MEDLSEKEQIEQIRAWWSEYGNFVIGGIVAGVAIMVGVNQYSSRQINAQTEASVLYESVLEAVGDGKLEEAETAATAIYTDYEATIYPSQARLAMARLYMEKGRDEDAAVVLQAIVDEMPKSEVGLVARLRLSQVLLYQEQPQDVVDLLSKQGDSAFSARYNEKLGDAYFALQSYTLAEEAYLKAMTDSAQTQTVDRALLQMKIDDLPDATLVAADVSAATAIDTLEDSAVEVTQEAAEVDDAADAIVDDAAAEAMEETPAQAGDEAAAEEVAD